MGSLGSPVFYPMPKKKIALERKPKEPPFDKPMCEGNVETASTSEDTSWFSEDSVLDISTAAVSNYYCVFENIPNIVYFLQKFNIPGVTARNIPIERPQGSDKLPVFAHSLTYDDLTLSFIMDEDFTAYFMLYKWMFENQYRYYNEDCYTAMMLIILNNAKVPMIRMTFHSVLPVTIDSVPMESQSADPILWTATLTYYSYKVDYLTKNVHMPFEYPQFMFAKNPREAARGDRQLLGVPQHPILGCPR